MEQDDNGDDWTFSLNHDEAVIKFTDSVTKVKGTKKVMSDEIELSRVLVNLMVQAALNPNENCTPVPNNGHALHELRFKLDSGAHGNLMLFSMCKSLFPGLPHDVLRKSIDKRVTLIAYNKQEIKQLGLVVLMYLTYQLARVKHINSLLWETIATLSLCSMTPLHSISLVLMSHLLKDGLTNLVLSGQTT